MRRRAVVTGAGVRVGRAIALELASAGFDVAVHYRGSEDAASRVVEACRHRGGDAFAVRADLSDAEGCGRLVDGVTARWDALDLLVNNASLFEPTPFESIELPAWERMLFVNLTAPFLLSQGFLPALRAASEGESSAVVHLCDIGAERPVTGYTHYSVSKAGLVMLVKAMAVELAPTVRTVGISPGHVVWPDDYDEQTRIRLARRIPMGRVGTPEDVARLVRFVSQEGTYLNGEVVAVDGGLGVRY